MYNNNFSFLFFNINILVLIYENKTYLNGVPYQDCVSFFIEVLINKAIWANLKEASIATKRNTEINQQIGYIKVRNSNQYIIIKILCILILLYRSRILQLVKLVLNELALQKELQK